MNQKYSMIMSTPHPTSIISKFYFDPRIRKQQIRSIQTRLWWKRWSMWERVKEHEEARGTFVFTLLSRMKVFLKDLIIFQVSMILIDVIWCFFISKSAFNSGKNDTEELIKKICWCCCNEIVCGNVIDLMLIEEQFKIKMHLQMTSLITLKIWYEPTLIN